MTFFEQFFSNTIFLTAAFGWLVAQVLKTLIHLIVSKKFVAERIERNAEGLRRYGPQ